MECARQRSKVKRFCFNTVSALCQVSCDRWHHGQTGRGVIKLWGVESQNMHDQTAFNCIPFILSGSPNKCWLHTCIITTWRLGFQAPLVARNYLKVAGDTLGLLLCIFWKRIMHEVQQLISTGFQDIHNWIKDERIILSAHVAHRLWTKVKINMEIFRNFKQI